MISRQANHYRTGRSWSSPAALLARARASWSAQWPGVADGSGGQLAAVGTVPARLDDRKPGPTASPGATPALRDRPCGEFVGGRRDGFRQSLPSARRTVEVVRSSCASSAPPLTAPDAATSPRRTPQQRRISPRASSASDSASRFITATSRIISSVSSSRSRSSGAIRTAEGPAVYRHRHPLVMAVNTMTSSER
jgi:hypothetical protein